MSYHYIDRDGGQARIQKMPPGTAPKPYKNVPQPYRPGEPIYHPVKVEHYAEDLNYFPPPPPPPDSSPRGEFTTGHDENFPPPPPPAPPQGPSPYGDDDDHHTYSNVYAGQGRYMKTNDYRAPNYGGKVGPPGPRAGVQNDRPVPGPMVPTSGQIPYSSQGRHSQHSPPQSKQANEAEVDALTDLLIKNMTGPSDQEENEKDFWGVCGQCLQTISGDTNACSALDNVYHIGCFTCVGCNVPLQGKSFFAMETKPYCEVCYVVSIVKELLFSHTNTLERCSVCSKPITDRLLRATGKPYHPECFTCVVCGKSLDGIPFTVDATNQIHCIEDFHKKFAPRCCVCQKPIMPDPGQEETVRIVAMDKSFHVDCYRCEDCGCQLSSEVEGRGCYPLDEHILCKNCNAKRIQALTTKMATDL
ncbi:lipoma-preferred partner-like protein [Elysia marginata]|uniref:Lipoma-preferred partner-like protein n=1 Tax=Elysia marginata TaxID=1093978 RepID=A0AAV4IKL5_9GAST|nr:lipoma-preferred partner-like protein [Elysia marginata]